MKDKNIDEYHKLLDVEQDSSVYRQLEELQEELTELRDARKEDCFVFIFVCVILLDIVFFSVMQNSAGPIALVVLELLILMPLAIKLGVENIATLMDRILNRLVGGIKPDD